MAFDTDTRNKLARMVADARELLKEEFTGQLQQLYGIQPDGKITPVEKLTHLDDEQREAARLLRERVTHLASGMGKEKNPIRSAVDRMTREQAFTMLNRFAALRMCEERGIIQQCVGKGMDSEGFEVYLQVAGTGLGDRYDRYCSYIFCVFDEIAVDLGILFDRFSPFGLLFPREAVLNEFIEIFTKKDLKHLWAEDETIGWIYQYYNDPEERKKMRKASAAPRNSRELAVRNQFFTPRYVVEFLTDNTLGRIWYEMTCGQTCLADQCRYLVRRPNEIFLAEGEAAPEIPDQEGLKQEELLKQPVHIPHRPLKDPREIRLLDPACGSMHFGLYAFDLFETIYEEAWNNGSCPALQEAYSSKDDFLKDVPRLIIEHNIHGIDIDPRAVQIAGLSLWLRAQKAGQSRDVKSADRPRVRRSNIVCAEPMPGSPEMLEDFIKSLDPPLLGELVRTVFDKMQLAGEAGSLLKMEEEIRNAIDEAKNDWKKTSGQLPGFETSSKSATLRPLTNDFWGTIEDRLLEALHHYAEQADAGSYQRRLFADDAARGFAFIDLCRKRYDVVVMNPPFGSPVGTLSDYSEAFSCSGRDIYAMFVERTNEMTNEAGLIGAIMPRTGLFIGTMGELRKAYYRNKCGLGLLMDLGKGVLDDATIRTACYVIGSSSPVSVCARIGNIENRKFRVIEIVNALNSGSSDQDLFIRDREFFGNFPGSAIAYWIPDRLARRLPVLPSLKEYVDIRQGIATGDNFRFLRMFCELPKKKSGYQSYSKGGEPVPFISDETLYVLSDRDASEMKANATQKYGSASRTIKNEDTFGIPGITYSQVNDACLKFRVHPSDSIYDMKGPVLFSRSKISAKAIMAFLNSSAIEDFMRMLTDGRQWHVSALKQIPVPEISESHLQRLIEISESACNLARFRFYNDETSHFFRLGDTAAVDTENNDLDRIAAEIDSTVWTVYGASEVEIASLTRQRTLFTERSFNGKTDDEVPSNLLITTALGCVFGRWDIRHTTVEHQSRDLTDPFDPLPVCPPGMLQNAEGLPAEPKDVPDDYPIRISWPGILVDDENHLDDIVTRVREAIEVIWQNRADAIEQETCEILGVSDLREYFRKPAKFFQDHLKRYSKSRRKAPIYWPLSTESGTYTIWIYYHRLTDQTLFTCVKDYLKPKIDDVSRDIERLQKILVESGTVKMRSDLEQLQKFRQELTDMQDEILRVAKLPYKPNLNDGVMITASPLWRLFRLSSWQNNLKDCWEKLEGAEYEWAHLAYSIWPDRVKDKCKTDRSIAIAHDLEHLCEVEVKTSKKKKIRKKTAGLF